MPEQLLNKETQNIRQAIETVLRYDYLSAYIPVAQIGPLLRQGVDIDEVWGELKSLKSNEQIVQPFWDYYKLKNETLKIKRKEAKDIAQRENYGEYGGVEEKQEVRNVTKRIDEIADLGQTERYDPALIGDELLNKINRLDAIAAQINTEFKKIDDQIYNTEQGIQVAPNTYEDTEKFVEFIKPLLEEARTIIRQ